MNNTGNTNNNKLSLWQEYVEMEDEYDVNERPPEAEAEKTQAAASDDESIDILTLEEARSDL